MDEEFDIQLKQGSQVISGHEVLDTFKGRVHELCNTKNLHFLFGAGTSATAISTMHQIKNDLDSDILSKPCNLQTLYNSIKKSNLEELLNVLYAKKLYLQGLLIGEEQTSELQEVEDLITYIQVFMFKKINVSKDNEKTKKAVDLYKSFYNRLAFRNKDLSRLNVFTTNNDLLNEMALDSLNINYNNGFGGGLERRFNPARFRYTFSKKIDFNLEKFEPLEDMVYLYKLHGSVNWVESKEESIFCIKEIGIDAEQSPPDESVLIYPTPLKQSLSLGSPYSDLIREFQIKLALPNSVLFIIGYSFSDEHLNNIIYQTLASNTSITLVIFGDYPDCPLSLVDDNRILIFFGKPIEDMLDVPFGRDDGDDIGGFDKDVNDIEGAAGLKDDLEDTGEKNKLQPLHYFDYIVNKILPDNIESKEKELLGTFEKYLSLANQSSQEEVGCESRQADKY